MTRVMVSYRLVQCDKENHGWREGLADDRSLLMFRSASQTFTLQHWPV
jgi:hypothetical protein